MSTELTIYDRIPDPMAAVKQLGHSIAASRMFGAETPAQGEVFALECLVRRTPPLMLAEKYHVIFGKLSMKAEAMLARFEELGGKHRLIERTDKRAAIELTREGSQPQVFSLTWEEALREPFVYEPSKGVKESDIIDLIEKGTPPPIKTKYRTPRSRMQMLWARVVSDGVNAVDPRVKSGTYTPEEISDLPENAGKSFEGNGNGHAEIVDAEVVSTTVAEPPPQSASKSTEPAQAATETASGMCTAAQSTRIKELWGELGATVEQRNKHLASRNAQTPRQLTAEQAAELISKLEAALAKRSADPKQGQTDEQIAAEAKELLKQVEQSHPGTVGKVKAKLATAGAAKLADLKREDLLSLVSALKAPSSLESYFGVTVWAPSSKN